MDHSHTADTEDTATLLSLIEGFRKSKVLFTAVKLAVFDELKQAAHALTPSALLERLQARKPFGRQPQSVDGLERLLYACAGLGLLTCEQGQFTPTPLSLHYLCEDSCIPLSGYILHSDAVLYKLWTSLDVSVCSGQQSWEASFGFTQAQVWDNVYKTGDDALRFMKGMHSFATLCAHDVLTAFDLSQFRTLVDLGGATGAHVVAACKTYPQLTGVVFDLPRVVDLARRHFASEKYIPDVSLLQRVSWVPGDFFSDPDSIPNADLFILSRILHDWDESRVHQILQAVYRKLQPGGALLVFECVLNDNKTGPTSAVLQSLNMLVGWLGKECTAAEYEELLISNGFNKVECKQTGNYLDVIIAYKPDQ